MKNKHLFPIFLIISSMCLLNSCEQPEIRKLTSNDEVRISPRIDDCTDCPMADCCCSITLTQDGPVDLTLCGSTSPDATTNTCGPIEAGLCEISGYTLPFTLTSPSNLTELFCMQKGTAFCAESTSGNASVRITCQVGQGTPQTVNATFNTPGQKVYFYVNQSCELVSCI